MSWRCAPLGWSLLLLAVSLWAAVVHHGQRSEQNRARAEHHAADLADRVANWTRHALERFEYGLRGARGALVVAGEEASYEAFHRYAATRDDAGEFAGARGFGFIRRVPAAREAAYLAEQRAHGRADFALRQFRPNAGERWVIEAIEPPERNRGVAGLDIASEPSRRAAALAALRSGQTVISAPVTIVNAQSQRDQAFLLLLPVYRAGLPLQTPEQREQAGYGWVYAPLLIAEVLSGVNWLDGSFRLLLEDFTDAASPQPLFVHGPERERLATAAVQQRVLNVFGRQWRATVEPSADFVASLGLPNPLRESVMIGISGLLLSLLLHAALRHRERSRRERLQQSRLAAIVESSESAIIGQSLDGRVTSWNAAAERLFGYPEHEAVGRSLADLILPPEDRAAEAETRRAVAAGQVFNALARRRHRDGSMLDVQLTESPVRTAKGAVVGLSSTLRDLTRQRAVEQAFHELMKLGSARIGREFIDRVTEALSGLLQADWVFIARVEPGPMPQMHVISGWRHGEREDPWTGSLAGTPCETVYYPASRTATDLLMEGECVVVTRGVSERFGLLEGSGFEGFLGVPLTDEAGGTIGHVAAFFLAPLHPSSHAQFIQTGRLFAHRISAELDRMDMERQRDAAMGGLRTLNLSLEVEVAARTAEIRRASILNQAVVENAGYAVVACNVEGEVTLFNPAAEIMLGYRAEDILGQPGLLFTDPDEVAARAVELTSELQEPVTPGLDSFITRARRGHTDEREWHLVHRNGERVPVQFSISALRDEGGGIIGYLGIAVDLTERKRLERALTVERDRYRAIIDLAPSAIFTIGADGRIDSVNARVESVFGYAREELEGQPVEILVDSIGRAGHETLRAGFLQGGGPSRLMTGRAVMGRHRDGHAVPIEVRLSRFTDTLGVKVIAIATDRSEQQSLAENEERWRNMANHIPHLVWMLRPDGSVDFISRQTIEYTGNTHLIDWDWQSVVHPEDYERVVWAMRQGAAQGQIIEFEYRVRRHDGVYRWFQARAVPMREADGRIVKWIGTSTDVDDRKRAEAQIRELNAGLEQRIEDRTRALDVARRDLQSILDSLPALVGYWDRGLRNRFANHAYRSWFGVDPASMPGMTMEEVLGAEAVARTRVYIDGVLRGEPQSFEHEYRTTQGRTRWSLTQYLPDRFDGEVRGFYVIKHDITELRRARAAAEAASAAKTAFLANMSHEIRTPMNAVLGMLQLLERSPLEHEQRSHLEKAAAAARTLLGILNDILDFTKIEAGKMELDPQPFALDQVLHEIGVLLAAGRGEKPIEIVFDIGANVPRRLIGDALRLKQILINLAGNALKFTDRGEVVLSVQVVTLRDERADISFTVRDTGIGMSAEQCRRVFESFIQAESSTTRRFGGTGLGLAISQRLALLMGGELHVYSAPGAGSTFRFTLGFDRVIDASQEFFEPTLRTLEVLLVEDQVTAREVIAGMLRRFGWNVEACADAASATLRIEQGARYDVAVLDWPTTDDTLDQRLAALQDRDHLLTVGLAAEIALARVDARPDSPLRAAAVLAKPVTASQLFDAVAQAHQRARGVELPVSPRRLQRLAGLRVLMVEDNVTNQVVAQSLLAAEGAQVSLAGGGNAAVVAVRVAPASFDLVLMDIQMPDMDGYEATRRIRALPGAATLPIVAMTANALRSDREECLRAGMNAHVSKPFDLDELVKVLQQCVADTARDPLREIDGAAMARELIAQVADDAAAESAAQPAIEQLPLVAAAPAISRLGGESRTYRQALRSALRDLDRLQQELGRHAAEPRALRRSLHTLKGLCGTLGARRLQALAQASERALLRDLPVDLGSALMPVFTDTLAELRVLSATLEAAEQPPRDVQVTVPDARLAAALQELEALLLASSAQAIDFCRQVEAMAAPEHAAALASICEATQQLDFPIAARQCRELIDQLTGQEARSP